MSDDGAAIFEQHRRRLFGIAYRMLGIVAEAEDLVQETWLRWSGTDRDAVREPAAFLATTVTRLAINEATSARARRETYVGPWLPEPIDTSADPLLGAERAEALSLAVLVLLEKLAPAERAAFVLREAFDYPHAQIADVLEVSEPNARQLVSRARTHLDAQRHRPVDAAERARLLEAFLTAAGSGDLAALESVLSADVVSISDGGGRVLAARKEVGGPARVAHFLLRVLEKYGVDVQPVPVHVNGEPAMLGIRNGAPMALWTVEAGADGIRRVLIVLNPEKLNHVTLSQFEAPFGHS
jgi:RNA polymerase sigma-70 factor, ECF subfamily